ncbi:MULTISPECIES: DNA sulfur modification protein DndD [Sphingobacterium]|uniref:DNA sulfur modification protein DndD n=1 Tax=Sphingobacterium phlebotomi TaxID=2605433 RepID=A0A5D4H525_9SPHI|nr:MULTISPECIES: DNA sulfur modification protein DndD [Sphingobacterium]NGM67310.1 DNA sulfur modification protein DndD [Sphingobacterium sp. SGR-19]TYR36151.1 DNA sulfur modification protein DndD [Sphingobacterium phlebotomi]
MKIRRIKFHNFRIYKGENQVQFNPSSEKNISIIAGRNGFGKTTFLTSLIWVFYGKMMAEVEEKYRRDIKNAGGYEKFLITLLNRDVKAAFENDPALSAKFSVEIDIENLSIPSIPCNSVTIRRSYDLATESESLIVLIDGLENELTKEVGYEVFINDFILPREIAKFFFFDAEKIVTLAEAKSKAELKNLSRAYAEVLGIKKYEDLKKNLETLLIKLRRNGAKPDEEKKLKELLDKEQEINSLVAHNLEEQLHVKEEFLKLTLLSDALQEKLIREGNGITLEELKELKEEHAELRNIGDGIRSRLKKMFDLVPLVMAGKKLIELDRQLDIEKQASTDYYVSPAQLDDFQRKFIERLRLLEIPNEKSESIGNLFKQVLTEGIGHKEGDKAEILLDYSPEQYREFKAILFNIQNGFKSQFTNIVQEDKNNRLAISRVYYKLKQAEARKDNPLAQKLREDKEKIDQRIFQLATDKGKLEEESNNLEIQLAVNHRVLSEYEKKFELIDADRAKSEVTQQLLARINLIIQRIKEDKKYSLQKSILLGLRRIMHKNDFVKDVKVNVEGDVMDIDLLDKNGHVIDKESLSKGEQQLYATALLKALVDESGIQFPVFIDSPLQKFDKFHSQNIIKEFYPTISDQVVLFPLLEKELSEIEYDSLKENVNNVYVIDNMEGYSQFRAVPVDKLFNEIESEQHVYAG